MRPSRIYLAGFMGSGKSTIGPQLAERLGYGFIDLDREIEREAGKTVRGIFEAEGEASFREREARALRRASEEPGEWVVALGGGCLLREENLRRVEGSGALVHLDASLEALAERLRSAREAGPRPLLGSEAALDAGALRALLEARLPGYRAARWTVRTDLHAPDEVVARIESQLRACAGGASA